MKTKLTTILAIVSTGCAVWLFGENRGLKQVNEQLIIEKGELVDQYFDLQSEYQRVFDETIQLEEENQILGSLVGEFFDGKFEEK